MTLTVESIDELFISHSKKEEEENHPSTHLLNTPGPGAE